MSQLATTDADTIAFELRQRLDGEVRFDPGSRHLYATDASNYRQVPVGVVVPKTIDDVIATVEVCRQHGVPITSRGGGTSLAGQCCNVAVVIDFSKYLHGVEEIDYDDRRARALPGTVLDVIRNRTQPEGYTWGPSPSTHNRCTVGGMIGNNACGMHAFAYGRTEDNVEELDILLYDGTRMTVGPTSEEELESIIAAGGRKGEIYRRLRDLRERHADLIRERFPDIPRRVSGYNLTELLPENGFHVARALVGTEGTCVTVLGATLELNPYPSEQVLLVLGFEDVYAAGRAVKDVRHADGLYALEGIDQHLVDNIAEKGLHDDALDYLPDGNGWLLCEFRADDQQEALENAQALAKEMEGYDQLNGDHIYEDSNEQETVWQAREAGLGATAHFKGTDHWPGWEDSAVHPDDVGDYLEDLRELFHEHGLDPSLYGHFGDGCIHCRIGFDLRSAAGVANYRRFIEDAADLCAEYGGSFSGEHGDGQQRGELLERMYGPELVDAMREFKAIWDPDGKMNPGKVIDARPLDADLRLGADYRPWNPETVFAFPEDDHSFHRAALRCVGVGKCRREDGEGTMCPSYFVTREEMHSTRGRARLLFEMLQPDAELDGWRDEHVEEALDLCLSCKACATDCPVNVDMATYKAEFLHHHYEGRVHPRVHYAMGLIDLWSRLAQKMPGIANTALSVPGLSWVLKKAAGVATERPAPKYAAETFREWFAGRASSGRPTPNGEVILFPDTFMNHFHPAVGKATVEVLEDAGYAVRLPPDSLCCGRPLYDYGFLDRARDYLEQLMEVFGPEVSAGTKIVGVEPSCVAVFRDELTEMFPHHDDANRIADATFMLSEFLVDEADYDFPQLNRKALVHGHCHHKGALGLDGESRALDALGLDWEELDASCCGLAGSFGFEAGDKYEVSVQAGERKLLPKVREAAPSDLIVADGFSCRTQIQQLQRINGGPGRRALHLSEVILMAKAEGPNGPTGPGFVEDGWVADDTNAWFTRKDGLVLAGVGLAAAAAFAVKRARG
ncbi:MAG: FAD-linked oxidase C-terminal domain-containing protein [Nitriliruptorales bacterium]|nr:FAD-linked oxidase C-terminal domain-containing protein [Nitriliruptorales bacterium]